MTKKRTFIYAAGLTTLAIGACNGSLKVDDQQSALDGGSGAGGSLPDGAPLVNFPVGVGDPTNVASCPSASPSVNDACETEGEWCRYINENSGLHGYFYCGCWEAGENDLRWSCSYAYVNQEVCPSQPPTSGSACPANSGLNCTYMPQAQSCSCPLSGPSNWECVDTATPLPPHPSSVPATTPINQLSDAEREAWCTWYLQAYQPPGSHPLETPLANGWTTNTGCTNGFGAGQFMCNALLPQLPVDYCKGNLSLSSCEAPIGELSDCVLSIMGACVPAPHGCARYMEKPGCAGTMALGAFTGTGGSTGGCSIQVQ